MAKTMFSTLTLGAALAAASLAFAADPVAVFKEKCAKCHGETGMSDTKSGKELKVPHLSGDDKVAKMTLQEVIEKVNTNSKHKTFIKKLTPDEIEAGATRAKELAATK